MKNKLKIGVFGGARGECMMHVLYDHPDAELVAVCDKCVPLLTQVRKTAQHFHVDVACYTDFEEFVKHDMDAVILANYANEHAPYAIRLMKMGKHVLSEVLPCETMAQAVELIEAAESTGMVYAYGENYCYMQHTFEMWKKYREGTIGEIQYGEGEYIHDCAPIWPQITYGERDHWRNRMYANFYCTHSVGPLLTITGLRPVRVVGFETTPSTTLEPLGDRRGAGIEMVTLENGAVIKSVHGDLKREPSSINYEVYGQKGMMESGRLEPSQPFNLYRESGQLGCGEWQKYTPVNEIAHDMAAQIATHGGSDFYATHFFIEKILGRPDGKWSIDVYTAVNMGICGILAYRSVLNGNMPMEIPDLRDPSAREAWRHDNACTDPAVAKTQLLPISSFGDLNAPDEVYDRVRAMWDAGNGYENSYFSYFKAVESDGASTPATPDTDK